MKIDRSISWNIFLYLIKKFELSRQYPLPQTSGIRTENTCATEAIPLGVVLRDVDRGSLCRCVDLPGIVGAEKISYEAFLDIVKSQKFKCATEAILRHIGIGKPPCVIVLSGCEKAKNLEAEVKEKTDGE